MERRYKAWKLFKRFFIIGLFTFGGGWSIVAQIQKKFVEEDKSLSENELMDIVSIGRSLPGIMIGNVAAIFGYHLGGVGGALACIGGIAFPPLLVIALLAFFYSAVSTNVWVTAAFYGVRAAVVPIILCAALRMVKTAFREKILIVFAVITLALCLFTNVSYVVMIIGGIILGLVYSELRERRHT